MKYEKHLLPMSAMLDKIADYNKGFKNGFVVGVAMSIIVVALVVFTLILFNAL